MRSEEEMRNMISDVSTECLYLEFKPDGVGYCIGEVIHTRAVARVFFRRVLCTYFFMGLNVQE